MAEDRTTQQPAAQAAPDAPVELLAPTDRAAAEAAPAPAPPVEVLGEPAPDQGKGGVKRTGHAASSARGVHIPRADWGVDYNRPSVTDKDKARAATYGDASRQGRSPRAAEDGTATRSAAGILTSLAPLLLVACVACLCAAVMAWGSPALWMTQQQEEATHFASGTDERDYRFISQNFGDDSANVVVLGEYQAIAQNGTADRASNLSLAAAAIDGTEIAPGQTISMNEILGDVTLDMRYKEAPLLTGQVVTMGRGGGVCQVATALYIAALDANLHIEERHAHAMVCDYAPVGLDAVIEFGGPDLKISNDTATTVFVRANALGQTVHVKIYGMREGGDEYSATSRIVNRSEASANDFFDDPAALGVDPSTTLTLYSTETYVVRYTGGVEQDSQLVSSDSYRLCTPAEDALLAGATDAGA